MISTISKHEFQDAFRKMGRKDQFSYEGQLALFEYLEQYEEDTGEQVELDVIALCCEYSEHDSAVDCVLDMGYDFGGYIDTCPHCGEGVYFESNLYGTPAEIARQALSIDWICPDCENDLSEDREELALEYLRDNTQVIEFKSGIIIQDF